MEENMSQIPYGIQHMTVKGETETKYPTYAYKCHRLTVCQFHKLKTTNLQSYKQQQRT